MLFFLSKSRFPDASAKATADHGGFVEVETTPRLTSFRVMLPMFDSKHFHKANNDVFQKLLKLDEI